MDGKQGKGSGGKGNAQIDTNTGAKTAPIIKQGQEPGRNYGQDPNRRVARGGKGK